MSSKGLSIKKLRDTFNRVYDSEEYVNNRKKMTRHLNLFKGKLWPTKSILSEDDKQESEINVNYIFSTVMTIAPMLTDNKPIWGIRPRDYYLSKYFNLYAYALEYFWDKDEMDMKTFDVVLSALVMGLGIFKVYYDADNGDFGGDVCVEIVDPRTFVIAPGYTDNWKAPWQGERGQKPLSWVKENFPDKWMHLKPDNEKDDLIKTDYTKKEHIELSDKDVTIYTVWLKDDEIEEYIEEVETNVSNEDGIQAKIAEKEKKKRKKYPNGRILTFGNGYDEPIDDRPSPFIHGKPPYVVLYDYKVPFSFMGMGEADQIEGLHKEFNLVLKKICDHTRRWATTNWTTDANSGLDPDIFKQTAPGGGNLYVRNPGSNPPEEIPVSPINRTAMDLLFGIPKYIEEASAVTDITKGMAEKKQRQSAREISTLVETAYTRTRQRVRNLESSIKRLCYLIVSLMQQYYSEIRSFGVEREGNYDYYELSNSFNFVNETIKPNPDVVPETPEEQEEYDEQEQDYKKFLEVFNGIDQVYADYSIVIETNSTLPLDKQSMANLFLQLASIRLAPDSAIDVLSLLEDGLKLPFAKKIVARLKEAAKAQKQPMAAGM